MLDAVGYGGQAGASTRIENYLGFPTGITGKALAGRAFVQAEKFGAEIVFPACGQRARLPRPGRPLPARAVGRRRGHRAHRGDRQRRPLPAAGDPRHRALRGPRRLVLGLAARGADVRRRRGGAGRRRQLGRAGGGLLSRARREGQPADPRRRPRQEHVALPGRPDRARRRTSSSAPAARWSALDGDPARHLDGVTWLCRFTGRHARAADPRPLPLRRRRSGDELGAALRAEARPQRLRADRRGGARAPRRASRRSRRACRASSRSATCARARSSASAARSAKARRSSPRSTRRWRPPTRPDRAWRSDASARRPRHPAAARRARCAGRAAGTAWCCSPTAATARPTRIFVIGRAFWQRTDAPATASPSCATSCAASAAARCAARGSAPASTAPITEVETDRDGYFRIEMAPGAPVPADRALAPARDRDAGAGAGRGGGRGLHPAGRRRASSSSPTSTTR